MLSRINSVMGEVLCGRVPFTVRDPGGRGTEMLRCTKTLDRAQETIAEPYKFPRIGEEKVGRVELLHGVSSAQLLARTP